jgi:hypothetical protein
VIAGLRAARRLRWAAGVSAHLHDTLVDLLAHDPDRTMQLLRRTLGDAVPSHLEHLPARRTPWIGPADTEPDVAIELAYRRPFDGLLAMIEVQLRRDERALLRWQAIYAAAFAYGERPLLFTVLAPAPPVAAWAREQVFGGSEYFRAHVIGPDQVPRITDPHDAVGSPELSVLSAIVHADDIDVYAAARGALLRLPGTLARSARACMERSC